MATAATGIAAEMMRAAVAAQPAPAPCAARPAPAGYLGRDDMRGQASGAARRRARSGPAGLAEP